MGTRMANTLIRHLLSAEDGAVGKEPSGCEDEPPIDPHEFDTPDPSHLEPHAYAWMFSGIAAFIAIVLSFYLIYRHLQNYTKPKIQKHLCRILLMVPIYAVDSWLSFRFYRYGTYIDVARDTYEAFVIHEFVTLLVELMGGREATVEQVRKLPALHLPIPLCKIPLNPAQHASKFMRRITQGTVQYVVIRPLTTIIAVILQLGGVYCPGNIHPYYGWFWIAAVIFVSVTIAMYSLVALYENTKTILKPHKPLTKFLAIKFVIFFSFWQSVVIAGFVKVGAIHATTYWTADNVASGIQNLFVCIEMVIASIIHIYCFSYKDYMVEGETTPVFKSFLRVINVQDVAKDTTSHIVPKKVQAKIKKHIHKDKLDGTLPVEMDAPGQEMQEQVEPDDLEKGEVQNPT